MIMKGKQRSRDYSTEGKLVRRIGKYGTGWALIISDGYCAYKYILEEIDDLHGIDSMAKILIKASKRKRR